MPLRLKVVQSRLTHHQQLHVLVNQATNVLMNEVIYDNKRENKTFLTDGLATCAAIVLYGEDPGCSIAFTHMSSEATVSDDERKETILNQMLKYILKRNNLRQVKMIIYPPSIEEPHLIKFIEQWARGKNIFCKKLNKGGDSAIFNIDPMGIALMISTSLNFRALNEQEKTPKGWAAEGIVIAASYDKLRDDYCILTKDTPPLLAINTFFTHSKLSEEESDSAHLLRT